MSKGKERVRGSLLKDVIVADINGDILASIGVRGTKFWKESPNECPNCDDDNFFGLEILGACDGPLFWVCETCKTKLLKYTPKTTLKYLKGANMLYSSPSDCDSFPYQESN